jgi:hypothetical protein
MGSEMQAMQERMDNVFALEETCRRQEVVIEKMEGQIRKLWNDRNGKESSIFKKVCITKIKNLLSNLAGTSKEYELKKYKRYVKGETSNHVI